MEDELESFSRKRPGKIKVLSGIYLVGLKKMTNLSQVSRCPGQDSSREPPEYKTDLLG
jgi:hypothetical protein